MAFEFKASPHEAARRVIAGKPVISREVFNGLLPEIRGRALTVTGVESANVMERVRDAIAGLPQGVVWDEVKGQVVDELGPWLGEEAEQRAEILLRTHGFEAFEAANWRDAQADEDTTHLQYLATEDDRVRDTHLALNGVVLPKDDPFWDTHTPPWEWGCRCSIRAMNPDLVEMTREDDRKRNPEDRLVVEGAVAERLRNGMIERGTRSFDVSAPEGDAAFRWHPDNLRLSLKSLRERYANDPMAWQVFEEFAKRTRMQENGITVWEWMAGWGE